MTAARWRELRKPMPCFSVRSGADLACSGAKLRPRLTTTAFCLQVSPALPHERGRSRLHRIGVRKAHIPN